MQTAPVRGGKRVFVLGVIAFAVVTFAWSSGDSSPPIAAQEPTPSASPTPDPFAVAEALAAAGLRSDAVAAAKTALQADPLRTLGPLTKAAIAASSPTPTPTPSPTPDLFLAAEQLAQAGLRGDAIESAKKALQADPTRTLGPSARAILNDPFAEAIALAAAGFDDQAATLAKQQLQQHPSQTLPPQLTYLNGQLLRDLGATNLQTRVWIGLQDGLLLLALAFVLVLIVIPVLIRALVPRVQVKTFDEEDVTGGQKLGKTLTVVVEDEYRRLKSEGGSSDLRLTRTPDASLAIPDAIKQLPGQATLVLSLLSFIPSRLYVISGTMHPRGGRGVGLTIAISDPGGKISASETFWEKQYDPAFSSDGTSSTEQPVVATYRRLALAAASWAVYQPPLVPKGSPPPGYMSADWESYALHRVAGTWLDSGNKDRATRMYQQALDRDPANWGSLHNLAVLQKQDAEGRKRAEELLLQAKRLTETQSTSKTADRSWYRIRFNLAITRVEAALAEPANTSRLDWLADAECLAISVAARASSDIGRTDLAGLRGFLRMARDSALVLLGGTWVLMASSEPIRPECESLPEPYRKTVDNKVDKTRDPKTLIEQLRKNSQGFAALNRDTRYQLACYFSLAKEFDSALAELRYGARTADEAKEDPSLADLRRARADDFEKVLAYWSEKSAEKAKPPAVPTSPLARIGSIGAKLALDLTAHGVGSLEHLQIRTRTLNDRDTLARELNLGRSLVDRWGMILRLRELFGVEVDVGVAELLYEVGVVNRDMLALREAQSLAQDLQSMNRARQLVETPPTEAEVRGWIESAQRAKPEIVPPSPVDPAST